MAGAEEQGVTRGLGPSWALPTPMLWEAGERPGSACVMEVKGLKRRPPTWGGLGPEFRV